MTTRGDTAEVVRAWLQDGPAGMPDHVLDAVAEQLPTRPQHRGRWRVVTRQPALRLAVAAAALVALALAGLYAAGWSPPIQLTPQPSPSSTASGSADDAFVDDLLAAWNQGDPAALSTRYDHAVGLVRFVVDADDVVASYLVTSTAIQSQLPEPSDGGYLMTRAGPLARQGPLVAFPTRISSERGSGDAITVIERGSDGLVIRQFVFGSIGSATASSGSGSTVVTTLDAELAARNAYDGSATAAFFDVGAIERVSRTGDWEPDGTAIGREAIAARVSDPVAVTGGWQIHRTGDVLVQGLFAVYPATWTSSAGNGDEGVRVFRLTPNGLIEYGWSIGTVLNAPLG